jgi:hypothetical protein
MPIVRIHQVKAYCVLLVTLSERERLLDRYDGNQKVNTLLDTFEGGKKQLMEANGRTFRYPDSTGPTTPRGYGMP